MKNKGNLLLEFLLNIFIFSVIMLLLLTFMKRAVLIQDYKDKSRSAGENTRYIFDLFKKNIKEREKEFFSYNGKNLNIFVNMKLTIKKEILLDAINKVSKAISTKNLIPVLAGIKFELNKKKLVLTASDNDITIQTTIDCNNLLNSV